MLSKEEKDLQKLCDGVVDRNVLVRQNNAIEAFMLKDPDDFHESLENQYSSKCPECGEDHSGDTNDDDDIYEDYTCESCGAHFEELDEEAQDVLEWWAVTNWLAGKLAERGEVIFDSGDCKIWGRCGSGQSIALDSVIEDITKEFPNG